LAFLRVSIFPLSRNCQLSNRNHKFSFANCQHRHVQALEESSFLKNISGHCFSTRRICAMEDEVGMTKRQAYTLYLCHALSTWQARSYEFAVMIFTTAAYPGGLRAASLIGLSISIATILFGPALGQWIDHSSSRLRTLLITVLVNRPAVIFACLTWLLIVSESGTSLAKPGNDENVVALEGEDSSAYESSILQGAAKSVAFGLLMLLGILESLSRKANVISIERDWVPVLAPDTIVDRYSLTRVNATMARIDVLCKMLAPVIVSWLFAIIDSIKLDITLVIATNMFSLGLEWMSATSLWTSLQALKEREGAYLNLPGNAEAENRRSRSLLEISKWPIPGIPTYIDSLKLYFASEVWAPSLAMCITHTSILSITGVTVVFLLNSGYSLKLVTIGEALSAFFELSSTFIIPMAVGKLAPPQKQDPHHVFLVSQQDDDDSDGSGEIENGEDKSHSSDQVIAAISQIGTYSIVGMALILLPTVPILLYLTSTLSYPITRTKSSPTFHLYPYISLLLLFCLAFSRVGRGTFALVTQQLAQARVPSHQRSSFAGAEQAFVSVFGLGHNLGTAIWSSPDEFGWLALASFIAVTGSTVVYTRCWTNDRQRSRTAWK
jgi:iron-regulated transporter 1